MNKKLLKGLMISGVVLLILGLGAATTFFYLKYQKATANPQIAAEKEAKTYVANVSKFMELPKDETPTMATVTDKEKLKDQAFFARAENGDKVFIYTKMKKAILYRPSTNKIIDVAPLYIGGNETVSAAPPTTVPAVVRVAILNGSTAVGKAGEIEKRIGDIGGIVVVDKADAKKNDYGQSIVIDLNGKYGGLAGDMAQLLGGKVASFPDGETKPDADIVIIAGQQ